MKKWKPHKKSSVEWWNKLTNDQKKFYRTNYQKVYDNQHKRPYPSLKRIEGTRNKLLTDNQIHCIHRFRGYKHE